MRPPKIEALHGPWTSGGRRIIVALLFSVHFCWNQSSIASSLRSHHLLASASVIGTASSSKYAAAEDASVIIFYNLFVPPNQHDADHAFEIVKEQLRQVASPISPISKAEAKAVLFYNLIGGDGNEGNDIPQLCRDIHPRFHCEQLNYYNNATESVTLRNLHEYCSLLPDDTTKRVTYLHPKGSFHSHGKQTLWRRMLTNAALHPNCLSPPDERCAVCGAQYYPIFGSMFPGNMFTASCSYVKQLLPPVEGGEYERRREQSIRQFFLLRLEGVLQNTFGFHQDVFYGLGRYQWEHWVGSHPSLLPCEMHSSKMSFMDMAMQEVVEEDARPRKSKLEEQWSLGPNRLMIFDHPPGQSPKWLKRNDREGNFRQYYLTAGHLIRWIEQYQQVPALDSWVYRHFPSGAAWRQLVEKHGVDVINAVLERDRTDVYSPFASAQPEIKFEDIGPNARAVFYQITIPNDSRKHALDVLSDQLQVIEATQKMASLHYSLSGDGESLAAKTVEDFCGRHSSVRCHQLGAFSDERIDGNMLESLFKYCDANRDREVVYLSNQLSVHGADVFEANRTKTITAHVLSKDCRLAQQDTSCNVCGSEFYALPFMSFVGNMFAARCEYVMNLSSPRAFMAERREAAGDVLMDELKKHLVTGFRKNLDSPYFLGIHQYSTRHWIGSHPDLVPCDVAPLQAPEHSSQIELARLQAPRRNIALHEDIEDANRKDSDVRSSEARRVREYMYLAGNICKWYHHYSRVPGDSSWVWAYFPDGDMWKSAVSIFGKNAITKVSQQYIVEERRD